MFRNIFVIYAPGCGGNHLANMLSLDSRFQQRFSDNTYECQTQKIAHTKIKNFDSIDVRQNLEKYTTQNNIFCGHWLEYVQFKEANLAQHFENKTFCVIQVPEPNSEFHQRLLDFNANAVPWLINEVILFYKKEHITKLIGDLDSRFVYIWPELLYNPDIKLLINDMNNQGLDISLDVNKAQKYHYMWVTKNFKDLTSNVQGVELESTAT
jgi:hypothetical protein